MAESSKYAEVYVMSEDKWVIVDDFDEYSVIVEQVRALRWGLA